MIRKTNDQPFKEVLEQWLKSYKYKSKLNQTRVAEAWNDMMGLTITTYTRRIHIRKNTVYIQIDSASLRQELTYGKDKIKHNLNKRLGDTVIETVVIQ